MHIPDFSKDTAEAEYFGGFSSVSQGTYEGHQVAIKVVNVYVTNVTTILSVGRYCFHRLICLY